MKGKILNILGRMGVVSVPYFWLIIFFLLPFLLILAISLSPIDDGVPPYKLFIHKDLVTGWEIKPFFDNFKLVFTDHIYFTAYLDSLFLAGVSTIFCLLIGYPIAYGIAHSSKKYRNALLMLVIIPFWTSLLIRVYAWMTLLSNNGLLNEWLLALNIISSPLTIINTKLAVIIGIVYAYLPFMILPLYSALEKINPSLLEAAYDLGCKPFSAFLRITLPLSKPGIIAGSMLVFIPAVGEFVIPDLLGGSQVITFGKILWSEFFSNRDWPTAAAVTIVITAIVIIPIMIIQRLIAKKEEANG